MNSLEILKEINAASRPSIGITAKPLDKDIDAPWKSKFGGTAFLPQEIDHPKNDTGDYLTFLAQLNFSNMPKLDGFPTKGVLQFYIDNDDTLGMHTAGGHKVIYISSEQMTGTIRRSNLPLEITEIFPVECPHALSFHKRKQPISPMSAGFEQIFKAYLNDEDSRDEFRSLYYAVVQFEDSHQVGGHASFVQDPPVFLDEEYDQYEVLLKMDYEYHINWGDAGIANFLIKKEDLAILDFSKTEYWWDSC